MGKTPNRQLDERRKGAELAEVIVQYLAENPHAQDTAEGIASYWIMRQKVKEDVKAVLKALRQLTKSGQLEKVKRGKFVLYSLKKLDTGGRAQGRGGHEKVMPRG